VGLSKIVTHHPLKKLLVHRKGATRSYPGQPVILGGSMETGSYLLQGTEKAVSETFASTAHGSGRVMSRARAKREFRGDLLKKNMEDRGIYVRTVSYSGLAEEAGSAYKNIAEVVEALNKVGISSKVASFQPLGNIKG
jgi:tRNA-splicing ligase RtcB